MICAFISNLQIIRHEFQALQSTSDYLIPYSFNDFISEKHPVRVVDQVEKLINIQPLLKVSRWV
jgi:hypothetical protein